MSNLSPNEDEISTFFKLSESQAVLNIPIAIGKDPSIPDVRNIIASSIQNLEKNCQAQKRSARPVKGV